MSTRKYDLVARALEAPPAERRALVDAACDGDRALRDEVLAILAEQAAIGGFLEEPAAAHLDLLAPPGPPLPPGAAVGHYRLVRVIASGGSGTVYEALQESPHRKVALKMMAEGLGSTGAVSRFRDEAEILARLNHPGVAHVYEAGVHDRLPWLALEYVEAGRDLLAHARERGLGVRERLELLARVCDAVHHGHEKGILHGDLKPSNILVGADGLPKVIDFGIARVLGGEDGPEVAGTPPYMSPEQCEIGVGRLDVRSDVYALGAVLYELLSGARIHDISGLPLDEALTILREREPVPLGRLDRRWRGDLAAIAGKATARDRAARYASAAALADDVRRYLARRPVEARPLGALYVAGKFARREPAVALLLGAIVLLSIGAAAVGGRLAWQKERERETAEHRAYVASLAAALAALRAHDVAEARQQLARAPEELRGWEWHHLAGRVDDSLRVISLPRRSVHAGAVTADGTRAVVVTSGEPGIAILDVTTGRELLAVPSARPPYAVAIAPGGAKLALGYLSGLVELRDGGSGAVLAQLRGHRGSVNAVAFAPTGTLIASAGRDRTVRLWDATTGAAVATLEGHEDRVISVMFDSAGERVASGGREGIVRIWDVARAAPVATLAGHEGSVEGVAWSPDGLRLASVSRDRTVRLWNTTTGTAIAVRHGHENNVRDVAFAPDGRVFATASWDRTLRLWDGCDGRELSRLHGHDTAIRSVAFVPGPHVVTFGRDIRLWRIEAREDVPVFYGHQDVVASVAFAPAGRLLASGSPDGTVRLWDTAVRRQVAVLEPPARDVDQVAFTSKGSMLVALADGSVACWTVAPDGTWKGGAAGRVPGAGESCALDPLHDRIAIAGRDGILLADLAAADRSETRAVNGSPVTAVAFDCHGTTIGAGTSRGDVALLPAHGTGPVRTARVHAGRVHTVAISPDGTLVGTGAADGRALLLDARTLKVRATLAGHVGDVFTIAFHPDGTRVATGGEDGTIRLWDASTGEAVLVLRGPRYGVACVAWSPDGNCLASSEGTVEGTDSCIRLWER
jgi:WD40 repeat protein